MNKRSMAFCYVVLTISVLVAPIVNAQVDPRAIARYDEKGRMIKLFGIYGLDNAEESRCGRSALTGTIVSVEYDNNGEITNFYVKSRKGKSKNIYLTGITYDKRLSTDEVRRLPSLIAKGKKVSMWIYACGTTGAHYEAEEINALN